MSSKTSVRRTTAPGVAATVRPTSKGVPSTISGMRGADAMSFTKADSPRATFRPPVSTTALAEAGLTSGTLLGASASSTFSTRKRAR